MNHIDHIKWIAKKVSSCSPDIHTKTGAVIVNENDFIISIGYNSFPDGIQNTEVRQERPEKYFWFIHAEVSAIVDAAKRGMSTNNGTMYMTCGVPCCDCSKAIINAGIKKIACSTTGGSKSELYLNQKEKSLDMLNEAGVVVEYYD